jgi:POT family proton-dependent oligopeptide transporter
MCAAMSKDPDKAFFGHPRGLSTLFFTEMWERLSFYGARTFLFIYMTKGFDVGGRGMTKTSAGLVMAVYLSSVYLLSLPGGWIADRFLGQRKAVLWGGIGIAAGNALLALPFDGAFYPGLTVIALGTGLLKPNVSTIVGQLYRPEDNRRDAGFTIFYMGINIGAGVAPVIGMFIAQGPGFRHLLANNGIDPNMCWKFAFALPAIGMVAGLIQYVIGDKRLGDAGLHPTVPSDPKKAARDVQTLIGIGVGLLVLIGIGVALDQLGVVNMTEELVGDIFGIGLAIAGIGIFVGFYKTARGEEERKRVTAMIPLFIGCIAFFGIFDQAATTLSAFAEDLMHRKYLGFTIQASGYQFINSFFVVTLASGFAWLWMRLAKARKEPTSITKFGIGMILTGISFVVLLPTVSDVTACSNLLAAKQPCPEALKVSPTYLVILYFFSTCAELCISPVGLSSMSKLAPKRLAGMVMGTWFLGIAIGDYFAGRAAGVTESQGYGFLFKTLIILSFIVAAALFWVGPMVRRMMANPRASGPADKSEKTEPEPLPEARTVSED